MTQLLKDGRLVFGSRGSVRLKRFLSEVEVQQQTEVSRAEQPVLPDNIRLSVGFIVKKAMAELVKAVAKSPTQLATVEWRDLERVLGQAFEGLGFDTKVTRPARDGGFDIELSCTHEGATRRFLVEVKHWMGCGNRPSRKIVEAFLDVIARDVGVERGLLLSTSGFTATAAQRRSAVEHKKVALGGHEKVIAICQQYVRCESGLFIPDPQLLPELLFAGTF